MSLFWISIDISSGFQSRLGSSLFAFCRGECNVDSPRFTSGGTPVGLLTADCLPFIIYLQIYQQRWELAPIRIGTEGERATIVPAILLKRPFYFFVCFWQRSPFFTTFLHIECV